MTQKLILVAGIMLIIASFVSIVLPPGGGGGGYGDGQAVLTIKGAVKTGINLGFSDILKYKSSVKRVKTYDAQNRYSGSFEMEGVNLSDIISQDNIQKKVNDGFDRDLDMYIAVRGRSGKRALFSYGEIFLNNGVDSVILTRSARNIFPHKHEDLKPFGFDTQKWSDARESRSLDFKTCAACHNGKDQQVIFFPAGLCVYATGDTTPDRFIEDAYEIEICQIADRKIIAAANKDEMWSDSIVMDILGERSAEISLNSLSVFNRKGFTENTVGLGKGFHGKNYYEGVDMADVINAWCGAIDRTGGYFVISAADGYRSLFSAGEIFGRVNGANLFLIDRENNNELSKGSGRFRAFIKSDFFIDRSIRSIKEIYYNKIN